MLDVQQDQTGQMTTDKKTHRQTSLHVDRHCLSFSLCYLGTSAQLRQMCDEDLLMLQLFLGSIKFKGLLTTYDPFIIVIILVDSQI